MRRMYMSTTWSMQLRRWREQRNRIGGPQTSVQDISVGFGPDRSRLNVYCKDAPGVVVVVYTRMRATSIRVLSSE